MLFKANFILAALAASASANHSFHVVNHCDKPKRAHVKGTNSFNHVSDLLHANGGSYKVSVPENTESMIVFGENGECDGADGPGCTRLECSFNVPGFHQCNLSRVKGFNVPMSFKWSNSNCKGGSCPKATSGPEHCWVPNKDDGSSIRQCNTAGVGLTVHLCRA